MSTAQLNSGIQLMEQDVRQLESNYLHIPLAVPRTDFRPFSHSPLNIRGACTLTIKHDMIVTFSLPHRNFSCTWTKRFSMTFLVQEQQRNMLHLALAPTGSCWDQICIKPNPVLYRMLSLGWVLESNFLHLFRVLSATESSLSKKMGEAKERNLQRDDRIYHKRYGFF